MEENEIEDIAEELSKKTGATNPGREEFVEAKKKEEDREIQKLKKQNPMVKTKDLKIPEVLSFLHDENKPENVFVGMKRGVFRKYGYEGALFIGYTDEEDYKEQKVYLDSLNPHVVFICGMRGSGKSYTLGVIAEELALKNQNIGALVVDPIGVFWSMRYPNKDEGEVKSLNRRGLEPKALENIKVFIPVGNKEKVPKETYDSVFSLSPSLLTAEDWCLTFGIERFSVTGLLLEKVIEKVRKGYFILEKTRDGKEKRRKVEGREKNFDIEDIVFCLENEEEINSRERGFKQESVRALVSRFEASKSWGVFSKKGTPLAEIIIPGMLSILDTSFLDDNVTALVIGVLARRILAARKIATRKEAAKTYKEKKIEEIMEIEIPPTWLFIDEAHTLIPGGTYKTAASDAIVEYVKQGRRPSCSLIFATQQPSAIDTKVLSQLDMLITHKLVFDDDIKAVIKRMPNFMPQKYRERKFLKTLPVGKALIGDRREETSRVFRFYTRPRYSHHEGRDVETLAQIERVPEERVVGFIVDLIENKLREAGFTSKEDIESVVKTFNAKYKSKVKLSKILESLEKKYILKPEGIYKKGFKEIIKKEEKLSGVVLEPGDKEVFRVYIKLMDVEEYLKKKKYGEISEIKIVGWPVYEVSFNILKENELRENKLYISAINGELLHIKKGKFLESRNFKDLFSFEGKIVRVFRALQTKARLEEIRQRAKLTKSQTSAILEKLVGMDIVEKRKKGKENIYCLKKYYDIPLKPETKILRSLEDVGLDRKELETENEIYPENRIREILTNLWDRVVVNNIKTIFLPVYYIKTKKAKLRVEAITGKVLSKEII